MYRHTGTEHLCNRARHAADRPPFPPHLPPNTMKTVIAAGPMAMAASVLGANAAGKIGQRGQEGGSAIENSNNYALTDAVQ